jgi:hypothetical protein
VTTSPGLQRITKIYAEDVMEFAGCTRADWLHSIRQDMEIALMEPTPRLVNRDAWLIHVAAMIARYVELPENPQ